MRPDPALEGTSGERRLRVLGRLPADLGYEPIAESVAPVVRSRGPDARGVATPTDGTSSCVRCGESSDAAVDVAVDECVTGTLDQLGPTRAYHWPGDGEPLDVVRRGRPRRTSPDRVLHSACSSLRSIAAPTAS